MFKTATFLMLQRTTASFMRNSFSLFNKVSPHPVPPVSLTRSSLPQSLEQIRPWDAPGSQYIRLPWIAAAHTIAGVVWKEHLPPVQAPLKGGFCRDREYFLLRCEGRDTLRLECQFLVVERLVLLATIVVGSIYLHLPFPSLCGHSPTPLVSACMPHLKGPSHRTVASMHQMHVCYAPVKNTSHWTSICLQQLLDTSLRA